MFAEPDRMGHGEESATGRILTEERGAIAHRVVDDDLQDGSPELIRGQAGIGEMVCLPDQLRDGSAPAGFTEGLALFFLKADQPGAQVVAFPPVVGELPLKLP
jgi:hypothetical protein